MERTTVQGSRAQPLLALGPLLLLVGATALAFGRVFTGATATLELLVAGAVSTVMAVALQRKSLLLATAVSVVLLVVTIGVLVYPHTTLWGLPTGRTFDAIRHAIGLVRHEARVQVAPTGPLAPLVLAAITAVWTAAFSAHALAVRAGSPLIATAPAVALVAFADTVMQDGGRPAYAVLFLIAALAVVFADGVRRLRQWGPIWTPPRASPSRRLPVSPARGIGRMTAIAVGAAVLLPGLLPGFGSGGLVDINGHDSAPLHIDPFVSVGAQLREHATQAFFQVRQTLPRGFLPEEQPFLRTLALDRFNGTGWTSTDVHAQNGTTISPGPLPDAPRSSGPTDVQHIRALQDFPSDNGWIPMAYSARSISFSNSTLRYDHALGIVENTGGLVANERYTVTSALVLPTYKELNAITALPADGPLAAYVELPSGLSPKLAQIAHEWTARARSPLQALLAIQDHLTNTTQFRYTLNPNLPDTPQGLVDFLTTGRKGFCQQFADAMAVLARELGFPTRLAVGYRVPPPDPRTHLSTITNHQAHTWVEVLFPRYGWVAFEPTPTQTDPVGQRYFTPPIKPCRDNHCNRGTSGPNGRGRPKGEQNPPPRHVRGGTQPAATTHRGGLPMSLLLKIALLIGAGLLVLIPIGKLARRAIRLRLARPGRERILALYDVFSEQAADVGLGRGEGETPREYRARLTGAVGLSDGHLDRLTEAAVRAAYAPDEPAGDESESVRKDARIAIRDVRRSAGPIRVLTGIYRLRP